MQDLTLTTPSLSTKDSKQMANKRVQATLYSAPDPQLWWEK
jgi:hypothetical protein